MYISIPYHAQHFQDITDPSSKKLTIFNETCAYLTGESPLNVY